MINMEVTKYGVNLYSLYWRCRSFGCFGTYVVVSRKNPQTERSSENPVNLKRSKCIKSVVENDAVVIEAKDRAEILLLKQGLRL